MTVAQRHGQPRVPVRAPSRNASDVWWFSGEMGMQSSSIDELVSGLGDEATVSWADLTGHDIAAVMKLKGRLGLDERGFRPHRDERQRPRLEPFADHASATILIPTLAESSLGLDVVHVVITDRFVLSVHDQPLPYRDRIEERAAQHPHLVAEDSAFLLFILLDEWLHHVEMITEELDERIEDMEERAIRDTSDSFLDDLIDLKELGFDLSQAVDRHHAVFDAMLNPDFPYVAGEMVESHYRDLSRRFERRVTALRSGRDAIINALNIFSSSTGHRTNRLIILLTMVSTVLLPMTVIFSFFGTNFVDLPLFTDRMFVVMWVAILGVTATIVALFVRSQKVRQGG